MGVVSSVIGAVSGAAKGRESRKQGEQNAIIRLERAYEEGRRKWYGHVREMEELRANILASGLSDTRELSRVNIENASIDKMAQYTVGGREGPSYWERTFLPDPLGFLGNDSGGFFQEQIDYWRGEDIPGQTISSAPLFAEGEIPEGMGTFGIYLMEKDRIMRREIDWIAKTGIAGAKSAEIEGRSAERSAYARAAQSASSWWRRNSSGGYDYDAEYSYPEGYWDED
ncbi:MAG: hypothetical protein DWQ49_09910 [Bacteroidetes bacterium]|nr:MAG: hypothetical protein DWQ49_09910 [Bacteroidota bacterium]